jgi:Rrf2 family transcriptional regulator, iron-sulfur cluster assembly transcription factor
MLSRPCTYAIRALTYLAMQPPGKLCGSREISDSEDIPNSFLCKILLDLRRKHLLRSYKGTGGGYELALPPDKINLLMIVEAIEEELSFSGCILEDKECSARGECALHNSWLELRNQLVHFLETQTLADLVRTRLAQQEKAYKGRRQGPVHVKDQSSDWSVKPSP